MTIHQPWMKCTPVTVEKLSSADAREIERLANQLFALTSQLRVDFLEAVRIISSQVDGPRIIALLRSGRIAEAVESVEAIAIQRGFSVFGRSWTDASIQAGQATAAAISGSRFATGLLGVDFSRQQTEQIFSFGVTNPQTIKHLQKYEFAKIRELARQARLAIRDTITAGMREGLSPLTIAQDVRGNIGLTRFQTNAVNNFRRMLQEGDSAALQRALRDKRFDPSVARAIRGERDLTQAQIDKMVDAYQKRYLAYRARTIARTEAAQAASFGNHEAWRQAVEEGILDEDQVIRKWHFTHDNKTRDAHREIPDLNPEGVGLYEPFKSALGDVMYPGDPDADPANSINCRCVVFMRYKRKGD